MSVLRHRSARGHVLLDQFGIRRMLNDLVVRPHITLTTGKAMPALSVSQRGSALFSTPKSEEKGGGHSVPGKPLKAVSAVRAASSKASAMYRLDIY